LTSPINPDRAVKLNLQRAACHCQWRTLCGSGARIDRHSHGWGAHRQRHQRQAQQEPRRGGARAGRNRGV